jgi:hypothetical protein
MAFDGGQSATRFSLGRHMACGLAKRQR